MSMMKEYYYEAIIGGYTPTDDGRLRSPERNHTVNSPILGPEERPTAQGRGWINHLNSRRNIMASPKVYGFRGRVHNASPGLEFIPAETCEDFGDWRPVKSNDQKKITKWLIKSGYRLANRDMKRKNGDGDYEEYWALDSLVGNDPKPLNIPLKLLKHICYEQPEAEDGLEVWVKTLCAA